MCQYVVYTDMWMYWINMQMEMYTKIFVPIVFFVVVHLLPLSVIESLYGWICVECFSTFVTLLVSISSCMFCRCFGCVVSLWILVNFCASGQFTIVNIHVHIHVSPFKQEWTQYNAYKYNSNSYKLEIHNWHNHTKLP
jgi:hypothetical protein